MGLFDSLKNMATEITDKDTSELGASIEDVDLKEKLQKIVEDGNGHEFSISFNTIEHKKIDNMQSELGLDYHQTVFFIDTTMMRNNGSRGIGATTQKLYWKFDGNGAHTLPLSNLLLCQVSEGNLTYLQCDSDSEFSLQSYSIDSGTDGILSALKDYFEQDNSILSNYQKYIDYLLEQDEVSIELLEHAKGLKITTDKQLLEINNRILDYSLNNKNWEMINNILDEISKQDKDDFNAKRKSTLKVVVDYLDNDDLSNYDLQEIGKLVTKYDYEQVYSQIGIKLQMLLGNYLEAKIATYSELSGSDQTEMLTEINNREEKLLTETENAVEAEDKDFFNNNDQAVNLILHGGFLPVEYAIFLGKSAKFVNFLNDKTPEGFLEKTTNAYQLTVDELASLNAKDYFLEVTNHADRPSGDIFTAASKLYVKGESKMVDTNIKALSEGKDVNIDQLQKAAENNDRHIQERKDADRELEEKQEAWDSQMEQAYHDNQRSLYGKLVTVDKQTVSKNVRSRFLTNSSNKVDEHAKKIMSLQARFDEVKQNDADLENYLVKTWYQEKPVTRGEFEKEADFEQRVVKEHERLADQAQRELPVEQSKIDNEINTLKVEIYDEGKKQDQAKQQLEIENSLVDKTVEEITSKEITAIIKKHIFKDYFAEVVIGKYDPDEFLFDYSFIGYTAKLNVPIEIAEEFRKQFSSEYVDDYEINDNDVNAIYDFKGQTFRIHVKVIE